jgi:hypothetical protein
LNPYGISPKASNTTNICLAVESGIRYMCLKNVSVDVSFKYRYAQPTYNFTFPDQVSGVSKSFSWSPTYHLFSGQLGVAYHF